jgi:AcrR family transcriptional regulator
MELNAMLPKKASRSNMVVSFGAVFVIDLSAAANRLERYRAVPFLAVWYHTVPMSRAKDRVDSAAMRERILTAAFEAFHERGYAATSTLEIATRARVSKRELYALVGNKEKMLIAAIGERAKRLQAPVDLPLLRDRATLAQVLTVFGTRFVREVSDPDVIGIFRLAIAEAVQSPEVARTLDASGRETGRTALRHIMTQARAAGLIDGRPAELAEQFTGLLWRDLLMSLLLGVAQRPNPSAIETRARDAAEAFLRLHPPPDIL